jgi:CBS domain protein
METFRSREVMAGVGAVASLVLGILVVAIVRASMGIQDSVTVVALLLVPLVVYGLISDRLMELTGPGGLGVKFKETAAEPLATVDVLGGNSLRLSPRDMTMLAKGAPGQMEQIIVRSIPRGGPRALTMWVREGNHYSVGVVKDVLQKLERLPNFRFIVVLNENDRLICYVPVWAFGDLLGFVERAPDLPHLPQLVSDINERRIDAVSAHPGVKKETASIHSSNTEALEKMERLGLEAIAVVDEDHRFRGVIERDGIVSQMMLALAKGTKSRG